VFRLLVRSKGIVRCGIIFEMISSSVVTALRPTTCNLTSWKRSSKLLTSYIKAVEHGHLYHTLGSTRSAVPLNSLTCLRPLDSSKVLAQSYSSKTKQDEKKTSKGKIFLAVVGFGVGALAGLGYVFRKMNHKVMPIANIDGNGNAFLFSEPPPIDMIARRVVNPDDDSGLKVTLFQYQACPFCTKVRAFLDFAGVSYDVIEVNPVTKKQVGWSVYKKVPTVVVQVKEGYQQLNDSSMIISSLASYLRDKNQDLLKIVKFYPVVEYNEGDGSKRSEIMNRYFLMFGDVDPVDRTKEDIVEERRWRKWSDDVLMHTLSPNIYRTWDESVEAFKMFDKNGDWERIFSYWERQLVIYVGAAAMYMIGKRLKKRHNLLDDVRQSLYNEVNHFMKTVKSKGTPFLGGNLPNLADLAVYACIVSIDGSVAFDDLLRNTTVAPWYARMQQVIESRRGKVVKM